MTTEQQQDPPTPHAAGAQCRCPACAASIPSLIERENLRQAYTTRRHIELIAAGMDPSQRERQIQIEIAAGAALQDQPLTVTRTIRGTER